MTWQQELAADQREHFSRLVAAGSGWHAYTLDAAEKLVRTEPMIYAGLVAHVESVIGPEATKAARRALAWFTKGRA